MSDRLTFGRFIVYQCPKCVASGVNVIKEKSHVENLISMGMDAFRPFFILIYIEAPSTIRS